MPKYAIFVDALICASRVFAMGGWKKNQENRGSARGSGDVEADQPDAPFLANSFLVAFLVELFVWGLMSPQMVQRIALRALSDLDKALQGPAQAAAVRAELSKLAGIGTKGKCKGNCNRDLFGLLTGSKLILHYMRMPLKLLGHGQSGAVFLYKQCMLLPHELFSYIGNFYPEAFKQLLMPSAARLEEIWRNMQNNPQLPGCAIEIS